jgi:hypothetical protein
MDADSLRPLICGLAEPAPWPANWSRTLMKLNSYCWLTEQMMLLSTVARSFELLAPGKLGANGSVQWGVS